MRKFRSVFIDISGICNAKCPYCLSGHYKIPGGKFITVDVFYQVLKRLTEFRMVGGTTVLGLYNWGEPFLHPQLDELIKITNTFGIPYSFSTNASVVPNIDSGFVKGLQAIIFSMPGFSQASYDRIHGFKFSSIWNNIESIVGLARSVGYRGSFSIYYHVYQFNMSEIAQCEIFCHRLGIILQLNYAILNNWDHLWAYFKDELSCSMLKQISQDLFSFRLRTLVPDSIKAYRCPQYDLLAIDENANVLLCCQVPKRKQYFAGNLLYDDIGEIIRFRECNNICSECILKGMARYLNTALQFPELSISHMGLDKGVLRRICRKLRSWIG